MHKPAAQRFNLEKLKSTETICDVGFGVNSVNIHIYEVPTGAEPILSDQCPRIYFWTEGLDSSLRHHCLRSGSLYSFEDQVANASGAVKMSN